MPKHVRVLTLCVALLLSVSLAFGQSTNATITGQVADPTKALLPQATVRAINNNTNVRYEAQTNESGTYVISSLPPGDYRLEVEKPGFKTIVKPDIVLHVQDAIELNFEMALGTASETMTVTGGAPPINTQSAAVSTTIDTNFVSKMPLNGRSFQTLIELAPGVVAVPTSSQDQGQFSVNGQRSNANYVTVDGVSANFGIPVFQGLAQGVSGSLPGTDMQGGFTNLASVDALQEFKIQTSTYAPEFGRSAGAQISLLTKSGQNEFRGGVYEYFRNDAFDARDWFDLQKPPLRFNDFGATLGGPIWKDRSFFFFSYEGQRFLLPQPALAELVPSQSLRDNAPDAISKALLNAFPKPNAENVGTDAAYFRKSYSDPNNLDSYSLRLDHNFNERYSLFARYNDTPSEAFSRSTSNFSETNRLVQNTKMLTIGSTQILTGSIVNELRLNASRQEGASFIIFDGLGGGVEPDQTIFLPPGYATTGDRYYSYSFNIPGENLGSTTVGTFAQNEARSINAVDSLSWLIGKHQLKFGFDYRWYSPIQPGNSLIVSSQFRTTAQIYTDSPFVLLNTRLPKTALVTPNYATYAQDTWDVTQRLALTYGLRWDINPAPHARGGKTLVTLASPPDLTNFDQSGLQLAPVGTPFYSTSYTQFAPRFGAAYQLRQAAGHETVLRAGWGIFYDFASTPFAGGSWPYSFTGIHISSPTAPVMVPVTPDEIPFPDPNFTPSPTNRASGVAVASRNFTAPRTYQWNVAVEQALGISQSVSLTYIGAQGRDLLRTFSLGLGVAPNKPTASRTVPYPIYWSPNFSSITYVDNGSSSNYHALQMQYKRALTNGLQALVNYTWSHSTDDSSSGTFVSAPGHFFQPGQNYGASDFDVRHNFSAALTYDIPAPKGNRVLNALLRDWSISNQWVARSGLPINVVVNESTGFSGVTIIRPDVVPGQPLKIHDSTAPGGWRLNPAAFALPAYGAQGSLRRNSIYENGAWQTDLALRRIFNVTERVKTEFRVEVFNVTNHPNFHFTSGDNLTLSSTGSPVPTALTVPATWGHATQTLGRAYGGGSNTGGFNPLFQFGGPRSVQLSLRASF